MDAMIVYKINDLFSMKFKWIISPYKWYITFKIMKLEQLSFQGPKSLWVIILYNYSQHNKLALVVRANCWFIVHVKQLHWHFE
jgi:hypothetical protein